MEPATFEVRTFIKLLTESMVRVVEEPMSLGFVQVC
jgi:hypothetical protein